MNWILDIATVAVLVIAASIGGKRGFVRSLTGFVILFVSVFGASLIALRLSAPVTDWVLPMVQDAVWDKIRESVSATMGFLPRLAKGAAFGSSDAAVRIVVFRIVCTVLYIVGFAALRFALTIFVRPLTRLFNRIPLVGGINKLLGFVIGLVCGVLIVYVASWVLQSIELIKPQTIASTHVLAFFANHSLVELFNRLLFVKDNVTAYMLDLKK